MSKKLTLLSLFAGSLLWTSCETDFSLNGDYEITPIVFGLLDHTESTHIFKITKAFMGDDDNLVYAQVADSSYFTSVDAQITEYKNNTPTGRSWQLHDSLISNKDTSGIFYGPTQKVYVFYEANLDSSAEYRLEADLNEGAHQISASTELIDGFYVSNGVYQNQKLTFAGDNIAEDKDYKNWIFTLYEGHNGSRYSYKYTVHWTEYYSNSTSKSFSATRNNGDKDQEDPESPGTQIASFGGLDFYTWMAEIIPDDPSVVKRTFDGLSLRITAAHYNFDQYMDVAKPVSSIAQVQPEFTNINGGLGLFSSRMILDVTGFTLNKASRKELCRGQHTGGKVFCSSDPEDIAENYYCP